MLDLWESLAWMEDQEPLVKLEDREPLAEEAHPECLEILEVLELLVCKESRVLEDLEDHQDLKVHQDLEEKRATRDPGVQGAFQAHLEKKAEGEHLVARESLETLDQRVLLDLLVLVESLVRMVKMALVP